MKPATFTRLTFLVVLAWAPLVQAQEAPDAGVAPNEPASDPLNLTAESLAGLSWKQASDRVDPIRQRAEQAMAEERYNAAAEDFALIAGLLPDSPQKMNARLRAAIANTKAGKLTEAKGGYDQTIALAKQLLAIPYREPAQAKKLPSVDSVKDVLRRTLLYKATVCRELNSNAEALAAIRCLRVEDPEYQYLRKIIPLQAQLEGTDAETINAREGAASRLSDKAKWAWRADKPDEAMKLADEAIAKYPGTGGAILAGLTKARILYRQHRYADARAVYAGLANQLQRDGAGFESEFVRESVSIASRFDAERVFYDLLGRTRRKVSVASDEWARLNEMLRLAITWSKDEDRRLDSWNLSVQALYYQGAYEKMVSEGQALLEKYAKRYASDPKVKHSAEEVYTWIGYALHALGRSSEAIPYFVHTLEAYAGDPKAWGSRLPYPHALFGLRQALKATNAPEAAISDIERDILANAPGSAYARKIVSGE
ncbi:MAG: hypothetical protein HY718_10060 [Planctomycetes bacterium]|nr:hypothetical protein [Planctomycetota bacterium]